LLRRVHDPAEFATDFPMPTLARDEAHFRGGWHWQGSNWVEMSWLVVLGLRRYGLYREATALAWRNAEMVFRTLEKTGHFREYYDSLSGEPVGLYDYIWSSIPAAMMVRAFLGIEPTAEGLLIMPELPSGWSEAAISELAVRGGRLSLEVRRTDEVRETECQVNGQARAMTGGRGVLIPWVEVTGELKVRIIQPRELGESLTLPPATPP